MATSLRSSPTISADVSEATHLADRVQKALRLPFDVAGHEVFLTGSIGIAFSSASYEFADDMLRDADTAMYRAKKRGRDRYQLFDAGMHVQAVARLQLETDLRRAIERDELMLHYQPLLDLESRPGRRVRSAASMAAP